MYGLYFANHLPSSRQHAMQDRVTHWRACLTNTLTKRLTGITGSCWLSDQLLKVFSWHHVQFFSHLSHIPSPINTLFYRTTFLGSNRRSCRFLRFSLLFTAGPLQHDRCNTGQLKVLHAMHASHASIKQTMQSKFPENVTIYIAKKEALMEIYI